MKLTETIVSKIDSKGESNETLRRSWTRVDRDLHLSTGLRVESRFSHQRQKWVIEILKSRLNDDVYGANEFDWTFYVMNHQISWWELESSLRPIIWLYSDSILHKYITGRPRLQPNNFLRLFSKKAHFCFEDIKTIYKCQLLKRLR